LTERRVIGGEGTKGGTYSIEKNTGNAGATDDEGK